MGWGVCHFFIVGLCGMCSLVESCASLIILIVMPLLACDLKINKNYITALNATQSFGMAIGAFLFGSIADLYGRKGTILVTLVIIFCSSMTLTFAKHILLIILSTFMLGMGLAGNNTVLKVYLIECLPIKKRNVCIAVIDLLWLIGYLLALGVSWSIVPSIIRMFEKQFRLSSWRVLASLGGTPSLMMACAISLLPPSPRYLLYRQRHERAITVLQNIYAINSSKHINTYPITNLRNYVHSDEEDENARSFVIMIQKYFAKTTKRLRKLTNQPFRCITVYMMLMRLLYFPGFVWFGLWNTHLFQKMKEQTNLFQHVNTTCKIYIDDIATSFLKNCQNINNNHFQFLLLISLSYILGEILFIIRLHRAKKKNVLILTGLIGALTSSALIFANQYITRIILSIIILAIYAINYTIISILILESYPTSLRGTVTGLTKILPHLLSSLMILFLKIPCWSSIILSSGILFSTAIIAIPLPDSIQTSIQE